MLNNKVINLKEFNNCRVNIQKWYKKETKALSIETTPYNTNLIFTDIIEVLIKENKKVIYVLNENNYNKDLIDYLKKKELNFTYSYIKENEGNYDISFINFKNIGNIKGFYDLCIIDDISSYSNVSNEEVRDVIEYLYIYSKRIIVYSIERIIKTGYDLKISDLIRKELFIEPRFINTRINLDDDIPYLLYDYLMWFIEMKRKVIIYVPTEEKIEKVYNYYINKLKFKDSKVIKFLNSFTSKELENIYKIKEKQVFIITNTLREYSFNENNVDIIALYSDDNFYSYKNIIYLCADVCKNKREGKGEVILVSKEISYEMDKAKELIRNYNKMLWEKGLLKL